MQPRCPIDNLRGNLLKYKRVKKEINVLKEILNKRQRIPKGQSKMNNREKLATIAYTRRRQTKNTTQYDHPFHQYLQNEQH